MSELAARLKLPGFIVAISFILAGCTGAHQSPMAPGESENTAAAASSASAITLSAAPPADLVGLDGPSLERLLGKPGLVRRDYPAEVWQYRNPSCVLNIYLYPDNEHLTVTHAEARAPKVAGNPMPPCIAKLAELNRKTMG